jgi:hypothetical protein
MRCKFCDYDYIFELITHTSSLSYTSQKKEIDKRPSYSIKCPSSHLTTLHRIFVASRIARTSNYKRGKLGKPIDVQTTTG